MLVEEREIYRGRVVRLSVDTVDLPNGHRVELEIVHHPGGAAIVALDAGNRVCLLRQFRHAAKGWIWELPAGKLEPGEPPAATASRELAEEVGVKGGNWTSLGAYLSSPGVFTEWLHLFLARDLSPVRAGPEDNEVFEVHWLPFEEAFGQVLSGEIHDAKTCIGLMRARLLLAASAPVAANAAP